MDNPLWGAPRIHGELLKLDFEVTQSGLAKYMIKRPRPPSQRWRAFLSNHGADIAAMDFVAAKRGFGRRTLMSEILKSTRATIMNRGLIALWTRMRLSIGRLGASMPSSHGRFSMDFTTNMVESDFRCTQ